jgi:uncharacterized protein
MRKQSSHSSSSKNGSSPGSPAFSRREFLVSCAGAVLASPLFGAEPGGAPDERIIDIHQHTNYSGRTDEQLVRHQKILGVTTTVLLPAGSKYGLAAGCGGNETVVNLARKHPGQYLYFANEVADLPGAREEIGKYLRGGAIGIGEQKFDVDCDSIHIERLAELAQDHGVPVLMHFQHKTYNTGLERFHRILEKFPKVNFIGHAQTWWGHIDAKHDPGVLYPETRVTPGGVTDRLLRDYPNMFGDLSAGSGLNSMLRDKDHARAFLDRHQDQLMFGSDCNDTLGQGTGCQGARILAAIRELAPSRAALRKILYKNAAGLLGIPNTPAVVPPGN